MSTQPLTAGAEQAGRIAVTFAGVLRGAGLDVPVSGVVAFTEALGVVGLGDPSGVYWAGRATLVRAPEDVPVFDEAFGVFFARLGSRTADHHTADEPESVTLAVDDDASAGDDQGGETTDEPTLELRFSAAEVLRHKDFADYSDQELADCHDMMQRMRFAGARASVAPSTPGTIGWPPGRRQDHPRGVGDRRRARSAATPGRRRSGSGGSCCCSTSAARWTRTPGRCCASCTPPCPAASASRRSPSAPG